MPDPTNQPESNAQYGHISLVGGGPGDPGYITLRGIECLQQASVVLYDYLVNPAILRHANPKAELICLGQHGRTRIWSQDEVNAELVRLAHAGKRVVRLKSGDPIIFARAAEELEALVSTGVEFEIVPGVTAAIAAGACAGIPLTYRDLSSAVAFVTGHENAEKADSSLDYEGLAKFPGTLVFYMGVTTVEHWTRSLMAAGKSPETPAAIVRRCSLPDQETILCRLDEVAQRMLQPTKMRPPVIVVVGEVTKLAEKYAWRDKRPLAGRRILVTRPVEQSDDLVRPFEELGAEVLVQPAIRIEPPDDWKEVDSAIARTSEFDYVVFSSSNGVRMFLDRLIKNGRDVRAIRGKIACVGPGTARTLAKYHLTADVVPKTDFGAEKLADELCGDAEGKRFLLVRPDRGREVLGERLTAAGAIVEQVVVYRSVDEKSPSAEILGLMNQGKIDWVTVTSPAIARSLVNMFGEDLSNARLISISDNINQVLDDLGYDVTLTTAESFMPELLAAMQSRMVD